MHSDLAEDGKLHPKMGAGTACGADQQLHHPSQERELPDIHVADTRAWTPFAVSDALTPKDIAAVAANKLEPSITGRSAKLEACFGDRTGSVRNRDGLQVGEFERFGSWRLRGDYNFGQRSTLRADFDNVAPCPSR